MTLGYKLGLVDDVRWQKFQKVKSIFEREMNYLKTHNSISDEMIPEPTRLINVLKRSDITFKGLQKFGYKIPEDVTEDIQNRISLQVKYEGYLKRQLAEIEKFEKVEHSRISEEINYMEIESIAYEARERLSKIKPISLGQAARISGVNRTDINALMVYLKKSEIRKMRGK